VEEGQKLLRIPNLRRMQVNTKVHEAMVARIRGDVRVPTHIVEGIQTTMMLNTDPFGRVVSQRPEITDRVREKFRTLEYKKISDGQQATIRVDALSSQNRIFEGHVRNVAQVASQADSWISDVKLYQTLVMIDSEVMPDGRRVPVDAEQLKPDMTAEVTITVDTAKEAVLSVPVQAIIGSTEMGSKREVFVKTGTGFERKSVTLGVYNDKVVEIREGLAEGDQVVINPKVLLAPDDRTRTRDGDSKGGENKGKSDYQKGESNGYGPGGPKSEEPVGPGGPGGKTGSKTGSKTGNKGKKGGATGPPPS
jgi:multidrug efflux pump subunit AcrA (membrane-fusion protein)